jgi:SARP family transcriptional regulator, regulator of embCAB operon
VAAERSARALIELDPYRESGYRFMMRALQRQGNLAAALTVYDTLQLRLRDDLGTPPAPETQALHLHLLTANAPGRR